MLDYLTVWLAALGAVTAFANWRTFDKLIEKIKQTETARNNMERERQKYEKMRIECELARDSYDTRLATLNRAETIAAIMAGKEAAE